MSDSESWEKLRLRLDSDDNPIPRLIQNSNLSGRTTRTETTMLQFKSLFALNSVEWFHIGPDDKASRLLVQGTVTFT